VLASAAKPPEEILAAMKGATNADHDFSAVMAEQDLVDLTLFIDQQLIDTTALINDDEGSTGDAANGQTLYEETCAACHGPGGNAINFGTIGEPEFLGHVAPDNPWEFVHKVRFGQPGWPMPSAIANDWAETDVADVLAYAQTFGTEPATSGGGKLYDTWWEETGAEAPAADHPLWSTQTGNTRSGGDTWRCKECHGWDYKGADGAYGSGSHLTGFTGVLDTASLASDAILAWLDGRTNADHDFSAVMGPAELGALATFLQSEMADVTSFVDAAGKSVGDPVVGRELFDGTCAACHGKDGKKLNFGDDEAPEYVGTIAVDNPAEFLHKAQFGQPGEPMPAGMALGWTTQDVSDLLSYAQTLPTE
jgi:thiosulfate dehydrogenase